MLIHSHHPDGRWALCIVREMQSNRDVQSKVNKGWRVGKRGGRDEGSRQGGKLNVTSHIWLFTSHLADTSKISGGKITGLILLDKGLCVSVFIVWGMYILHLGPLAYSLMWLMINKQVGVQCMCIRVLVWVGDSFIFTCIPFHLIDFLWIISISMTVIFYATWVLFIWLWQSLLLLMIKLYSPSWWMWWHYKGGVINFNTLLVPSGTRRHA